MEPQLGAEIKSVLEEMKTKLDDTKITINEPPHFFCSHSDESNCARVVTKRKVRDVSGIIFRYEKYVGELIEAVNAHNEKRTRLEELEKEIAKLVGPEAAVVETPSAPAPVPAAVPVAPVQPPAKPVAKAAGASWRK